MDRPSHPAAAAARVPDAEEHRRGPEPAKADFFLATQVNGGGDEADSVTIDVTGMESAGTAQCAVRAGNGSHRIPMMELVNQIPAFDTVEITVG